jgi:hypothetical protein
MNVVNVDKAFVMAFADVSGILDRGVCASGVSI